METAWLYRISFSVLCLCVCGFCLECEYYSVLLGRIWLLSSYSRQRLLKSTCRFHVTLKRVIYDTRFYVVALHVYDVCVCVRGLCCLPAVCWDVIEGYGSVCDAALC